MNQTIESGAKVVHDMNGHSPEMDYAHIPEAWKTHCRIVARAVFVAMVEGLTDEHLNGCDEAGHCAAINDLDRDAMYFDAFRAALIEATEVEDD